MPFSLESRYKILTYLNLALLRSYEERANHADWGGDLYHFSAKLNPTEYLQNRPKPLLFRKDDIWQRLDKIEAESEFLVAQFLEALAEYENVEAALKQERSSPNSALKKADVLEWSGSRTAAMELQRDELIEKMRYFLELPPTPTNNTGGGILYRS